ncbi:MAG TPA: 3'-5' exonuclease [Bacteriovoracaceae bacterium]|nr:3'-5' exonuclease [Bacteriovoracaceae bacterium]
MSHGYLKFISKEEINELPLYHFEGKFELIDTNEKALTAVKEISEYKVLGFDTETRPSFRKGEVYKASLLQLATVNRTYLFRLNKLSDYSGLSRILTDEHTIKVGVAILDDVKGLQKLFPVDLKGFVDIAKHVEKQGFTSFGLRALTAIFLGKRLSKKAKITNWEKDVLTSEQLTYAACDAQVGLLIYQKILGMGAL